MTRILTLCTASTSLALALLMPGCATAPGTTTRAAANAAPIASLDCSRLGTEIARTEAARQAAEQKGGDAWKAVIPFAVIARYGSGKAAEAEAEQHLAELRAEAARKGCAAQVG